MAGISPAITGILPALKIKYKKDNYVREEDSLTISSGASTICCGAGEG